MKLNPVINIGKANDRDKNLCGDRCPYFDRLDGTCFLFVKLGELGEAIGTELKQYSLDLQYLRCRQCLKVEVK